MSMPIGVGIVIDDQIRDTRVGDGSSSGNQNPHSLTATNSASGEKIRQGQESNEYASASDSRQNQSDNGDIINEIIQQLEKADIPLVKYRDIPSLDVIKQFGQVSFLLLDWKLLHVESSNAERIDAPNPMIPPETLQQMSHEDKLSFIEEFHKTCFAPVLVFTNEDINDIKKKLADRNLYRGDGKDFILVKRKEELKSKEEGKNNVVETVSNWVQSTPVTHLVSEWNKSVFSAQGKMFHDFWQSGHDWPQILWDAYQTDGPNRELTELLEKNLCSRIHCSFDQTIFENPHLQSSTTEADVIRVLEGASFIGNNSLENSNGCGDLFFIKQSDDVAKENFFPYLLLISCDCDIIQKSAPQDNYLVLVGKAVPLTEGLHKKGGVVENPGCHYAFPIHGAQCIRFDFKKHKTYEPSALQLSDRVGRIVPPLLTVIRQRYAQWVQREGLPAMPRIKRS